jgi:hypothetical protein
MRSRREFIKRTASLGAALTWPMRAKFAIVLGALAAAFLLRVVGQLLVALLEVRF